MDEATRMIAMGEAALMQGFALVGFETWPDATAEDAEALIGEVLRRGQKALIVLEPALVRDAGPALDQARREGGQVVVTEVPPLRAPQSYRPEVEDLVVSILGSGALEEDGA